MQDTNTQDTQKQDAGAKMYELTEVEGPLPEKMLEPGRYVMADQCGVMVAVVLEEPTRPRTLADQLEGTEPALGQWWSPAKGGENG